MIALGYHDAVHPGAFDASGFSGRSAGSYKLLITNFEAHLRAVSAVVARRATVPDLSLDGDDSVLLTFDDGGISAYTEIADRLESNGWRGHFFIATDYIGKPGFLSNSQIAELHRRGHVIGGHSCSHPLYMARCSAQELLREWSECTLRLSDIIGTAVTVASVPGGMTSAAVADAAASAGVRYLFTSEPVTRPVPHGPCVLLGRFHMRTGMSPSLAGALAMGKLAPRARLWLAWNVKSFAKRGAVRLYDRLREGFFARYRVGVSGVSAASELTPQPSATLANDDRRSRR